MAKPCQSPIFLEGRAIRRIGREKYLLQEIDPGLYRIIWIVRHDVLVFSLDASEQLGDEPPRMELIASQSREIADLAVESLRQARYHRRLACRHRIAAVGVYGAKPEVRLVQPRLA
jgi:hypothetical protein